MKLSTSTRRSIRVAVASILAGLAMIGWGFYSLETGAAPVDPRTAIGSVLQLAAVWFTGRVWLQMRGVENIPWHPVRYFMLIVRCAVSTEARR